MVSVCAPVAARSATRSPGLAPRFFHFGKQHGRDGGHVGSLGAGNAGDQIHRADQHVMQSAAHMAEQAGEEGDHRARHAGHLDQEAEKHEQRHREQDDMAHAFIHAADQHHLRSMGCQHQIAEDRQAERERDRHAGEHAACDDADEEDHEVQIAEWTQHWLGEPERRGNAADDGQREDDLFLIGYAGETQQREQHHESDPDGQRGRAPRIGDLQRGRGDVAFLIGILIGRPRDHQQERQCRAQADELKKGACGGFAFGDHRCHPHVFGAAKRDRRAEHRQPQEKDGRQFVRPDQRPAKSITRHHANEEQHHFSCDEYRRRNFDRMAENRFDAPQQRIPGWRNDFPARRDIGRLRQRHVRHVRSACRCCFPEWPTLRRRICPSTRNRSRPSAACRGTAPDPAC